MRLAHTLLVPVIALAFAGCAPWYARYGIADETQLRSRLQGEKVGSYRQCYDQSCQIELGKAIAAQKTLASKLLKVGETCAITATLYDLKTETAERGASVRVACEDSKLMDGIPFFRESGVVRNCA